MPTDLPSTAVPTHAPTGTLRVKLGAAIRETITLERGVRLTVGRSNGNHVVLPDEKCSRQHCEIFARGGHWIVRDLESRNGIFVNGQRISETIFELGMQVRVGDWDLEYGEPESPESDIEIQTESDSFVVVERQTGSQLLISEGHEGTNPGQTGLEQLVLIGNAFDRAESVEDLCKTCLDSILRATKTRSGCVHLGPRLSELKDVASRIPQTDRWQAVVQHLAGMVFRTGDGCRFEDTESGNDSPAILGAIAVPIRALEGGKPAGVVGVIQFFASSESGNLGHSHLEFAAAAAEKFSVRLDELQQKADLKKSLERTEGKARQLQEQLGVETELVGSSQSMDNLRRTIGRIARTDATVLIRGESGVGKELVARAVHYNSERKGEAFVCVNCAALTESLLESELFGHEKGAFTGAGARKTGKFEMADGGTLFLDEIGEMSAEVQAKFLRVLEGQAFERVGGSSPITVDVRVVTATNRNLEEAVEQGQFRGDLYFRLHVIQLEVPPLRDRFEDVPEIARFFVERYRKKTATQVVDFTPAAMAELKKYPWPGNVRELKNVVERAIILTDKRHIDVDDISLSKLKMPSSMLETGDFQIGPADVDIWAKLADDGLTLDDVEHRYVAAALEKTDWNKSAASRLLGIERTTLDRKIKKYDLKKS